MTTTIKTSTRATRATVTGVNVAGNVQPVRFHATQKRIIVRTHGQDRIVIRPTEGNKFVAVARRAKVSKTGEKTMVDAGAAVTASAPHIAFAKAAKAAWVAA